MVRKGSPVRVRQRALTKSPQIGDFVFLGTGPVRDVVEHLRNTATLPTGRLDAPRHSVCRALGRFGAVQPAADALDLLLTRCVGSKSSPSGARRTRCCSTRTR